MSQALLTRVPTPCIGVCSTGIGDVVCRGCKRYAHEVIDWNSYSEAQKRAISERLEQLLTQIVAAKLTVFDVRLLAEQLQVQRVRYSAHKNPLVWVFELLRAGATQITDSRKFGFAVDENYRHIGLLALREQIDREFFILSEAHYERYIGQRYMGQRYAEQADSGQSSSGQSYTQQGRADYKNSDGGDSAATATESSGSDAASSRFDVV